RRGAEPTGQRTAAGPCVVLLGGSGFAFFFSSRRRHTRFSRDWSSDVCSSDLKVGGMVLSPEEKWVVDLFNKKYTLPSDRAWSVYLGAYAREHRRIFGYAQFDSSVQFEGFLRFWASLFASGAAGVHKAIYLHSDMFAEYVVRFPHLRAIFELYPRYDTLVSVSRTIRDIDRKSTRL